MSKNQLLTVAMLLSAGALASADNITGALTGASGSVDISTGSVDFADFNGPTFETKSGNPAAISNVTESANNIGKGGDSKILTNYSGGTPDATVSNSPNFYYTNGFNNGESISFTQQLVSSFETVRVYLTAYDSKDDISASLSGSGATFGIVGTVLPTTDGDNTGQGHDYGLVTLQVNGTVGETLTFSVAVNKAGVSNTSFSNVGINSVAVAVPEPSTSVAAGGALIFAAAGLRRRAGKSAQL